MPIEPPGRGQGWLLALGGVALVVLGATLLGQSNALALLGVVLVVAGVAGIVVQLLRLTRDGGEVGGGRSAVAARVGTDLLGVSTMSHSAQWAAGIAMAVLALLGLFLVSRAADGMFTVFGGLLFLFGIATIIALVHRATDYRHGSDAGDEQAS